MSRLPKIVGIFIYFFVLITSFYHVFKFYEIFESESETFVAFFVAVGFELSVLYFAYIHTKFKLKVSAYALALSLFIVWFGNIFVMAGNVFTRTFSILFLNNDVIKIILAFIGSVFLPVGSFFMGKILAKLDLLREERKSPIEIVKEESLEIEEIENVEELFTEDDNILMETSIETVQEKITEITTDINLAFQSFEGISSNVEAVNEEKQDIVVSTIETVGEDMGTLPSNISTVNEEVNGLSSAIETVNEEVNLIPSTIETVNEDTQAINSNINSAIEEQTQLPSNIEASIGATTSLKAEIEAIGEEVSVQGVPPRQTKPKPIWEDIKEAVTKSVTTKI